MRKKGLALILSLVLLFSVGGTGVSGMAAEHTETYMLFAMKPAKVKGLKASATCKQAVLQWKKVKNADGYLVYAATEKSGKYKKVKTVKKNAAKLKLKAGKTRYYKVAAYRLKGKKKVAGALSAAKKATAAHAPSTSWTVVRKPTCANTGLKRNTCKYCKKSYTVTTEKDVTAHQYAPKAVEATKEFEAYTVYICKLCGESYNSKIKAHKYETEKTAPTCTQQGYTTYRCSRCGYTYTGDDTSVIPHTYETVSIPANCTDDGYTVSICTVCGYADQTTRTVTEPATGTEHIYEKTTVAPSCTVEGYTAMVCAVCGYIDEATKVTTPALGHAYSEEYAVDTDGFRRYDCTRCDEYKLDTTCYIDITKETVSVPKYAVFGKSSTNTTEVNDKLDIYTDGNGVVDFEITGTRENFTIDVNATAKTEVKLNGLSLMNTGRDCINVKDKTEDITDENGVTVHKAPKVYLSAKDATESVLITNTSGNAIDSSCPLELRGHGTLTLKCYDSTAVDNKAKLTVKNLTLDILSGKRGIDTELTTQVEGIDGALVPKDDYFNVEIEPNANIKIKSANDCIRCKNLTVLALAEGDTATVMNLESTLGDGIQLEGNKGFNAYSGDITIKAGKYAFNCIESLVYVDAAANVIASGTSGYAKPVE